MKKTGVLILALMLCATVLVGCGIGAETDSVFGMYHLAGAKQEDSPVDLADIGPEFTPDKVFCEFRSDGTFMFNSPKNIIIEGTFTVAGSEIIFKAYDRELSPPTTTIDGNKILMNENGTTFILEKK